MAANANPETSVVHGARWADGARPVVRVLDAPGWCRIVVVACLLLIVYRTAIIHNLGLVWLNDANWSHGALIPLFSLYFLHARKDELARCQPRPSYLGAVLLALSLLAFFYFSWIKPIGYVRTMTLIPSIFGVTLLLGGWPVMRHAWFPILFVALSVPIPYRYFVSLTMPLQQLASSVASTVLPLLAPGLETQSQAVVIDYFWPGHVDGSGRPLMGVLNVAEACSGMRSLMVVVTLGAAVAYLERQSWWQRAILVASCVPIAIFCNSIRVVVTGLLYVYGHDELASGTPHKVLGIAVVVLAFGLFLLLGWILRHLFVDAPDDDEDVERHGRDRDQAATVAV